MLGRPNEIRNAQQVPGWHPLYPGLNAGFYLSAAIPPYLHVDPVQGECDCEQCEENREYYESNDEFEDN
jgi:hypothetical protein